MTTPAAKNGCHNRAPYRETQRLQDGWDITNTSREPRMKWVPFRMSQECNYTHTVLGQQDARCAGCKWRADKVAA